MGENFHLISDMGKLAELKYKKRPIIAEFYTEYFSLYVDGVLLASPPVPSSKKNSKKLEENFHLPASIVIKLRN